MRSHKHIDADAYMYSSVRDLFEVFAGIYDTKSERVTAITRQLTTLLGKGFDDIGTRGVRSDRVMIQHCGPSRGYLLILEVKYEIGTGSADPYNQSSIVYRKYWADESHKSDQFTFMITQLIHCLLEDIMRKHCRCPSIMLAIAGPWLCVLGGVYLENAVTQPLTDYVWLGGDHFNKARLFFGIRLFSAL
jgi:hypothetical protein